MDDCSLSDYNCLQESNSGARVSGEVGEDMVVDVVEMYAVSRMDSLGRQSDAEADETALAQLRSLCDKAGSSSLDAQRHAFLWYEYCNSERECQEIRYEADELEKRLDRHRALELDLKEAEKLWRYRKHLCMAMLRTFGHACGAGVPALIEKFNVTEDVLCPCIIRGKGVSTQVT